MKVVQPDWKKNVRLAYVGITRAKKSVVISFAANRQMHGQWKSAVPSRFVDELPDEHILIDSEKGLVR